MLTGMPQSSSHLWTQERLFCVMAKTKWYYSVPHANTKNMKNEMKQAQKVESFSCSSHFDHKLRNGYVHSDVNELSHWWCCEVKRENFVISYCHKILNLQSRREDIFYSREDRKEYFVGCTLTAFFYIFKWEKICKRKD